ncbi:putative glycolipid-binding domain-containing protein [Luteimicrobium sp. NPDC057192]|uniref:putative glycolipid-binding domain-containing protein n=1 Tax=Luteimicrobium sp. NPDC057192 TaxID=3346042 RepID=UPI00362F2015
MARDRTDLLGWAQPGARVAFVDDARPDVVEERTVARVTRSQVVTDDGAHWRRQSLQRSGPWAGALRVLSGIRGKSLAPLDHPEVARRRTPPLSGGVRPGVSTDAGPAGRTPPASRETAAGEATAGATAGAATAVDGTRTRTRRVVWVGEDDPHRVDTAVLTLDADSLRGSGTSRTDAYALSWTLVTGPGWVTRRLDVAVRGLTPQGAPWSRDLVLERGDDGRWRCDASAAGTLDAPPPGLPDPAVLDDAVDCDLGLCPATNTMPALRVGVLDADVAPTDLVMAWVEVPSLRVAADRQTYAGAVVDGRRVARYASDRYTVDLTLDADGVVTRYPGLARAVDVSGA